MGVAREVKRRRLSPSDDDHSSPAPNSKSKSKSKTNGASSNMQNAFYSQAAEWDLEQDYERRPRKGKNKKEQEKTRLPIKTAEGGIVHVDEPEDAAGAASDSDSFLDTDSEGENGEGEDDEAEKEAEVVPKIPLKLQIVQAKEEMAKIATLINEDPEEHIGLFKKLADYVDKQNSHVAIKKLALAAQAAVFKDVIPGYRIRPLGDEVNKNEKLSKEVRKLRGYEQSLLSSYKHYIHQLTNLSKGSGRQYNKSEENATNSIRTVAINCTCSMLLAVPHFNFRTELLKIIVNRLSKRRIDANFVKSRETMEDIFAKDDDGIVSLEAVGLMSKMMRAKDFHVHESALNTFLHLRLLSEFSSKASRDRVDRDGDDQEGGLLQGKKKNKKEFRTKRERKVLKDRKAVEKDMREADALVSHEARERNQAETLKLVFGTYFRILKLRTETKLMGAVLEGLAKYAHLINQDFFGDVLEALKELVAQLAVEDAGDSKESDNQDDEEAKEDEDEDEGLITLRQSTRQVLLCTITAFALLEGQDVSKSASALHLDLSFFVTHLYRALYPLALNADIEYNPDKSLRLPDPGYGNQSNNYSNHNDQHRRRNKVNFQTPMVLLLRCLQSTLLARTHGIPPPIRLAGFTKRLMTMSLQLPEKSSIAMLALLSKVSKQHARKISPLWNTEERKGDGVFNSLAADVEKSNVFAGTVWEGELLRLHYCPEVREAVVSIDKLIASEG